MDFSSESGPECTSPKFFIVTTGGSLMGAGDPVLPVVACVVVDVVVVRGVVGTKLPFSIK